MFLEFLCDFFLIFIEAEDASSNDNKDISASTHPNLFTGNEGNFFAVYPGISADCQDNADHLKLELNIDGEGNKGRIEMSSSSSVYLSVQNVCLGTPLISLICSILTFSNIICKRHRQLSE